VVVVVEELAVVVTVDVELEVVLAVDLHFFAQWKKLGLVV
jgi:hypothetical protein